MAENSIKTNPANRGPPVARKPKRKRSFLEYHRAQLTLPLNPTEASSLVTAYLVVYNTISLLCWGVVLFKTVSFILQRPTVPHLDNTKILPTSASAKLSSLLSLGASKLQNHVSRSQTATAGIPIPPTGILAKLRTYLGGSYVYEDLGPWVVLTQTGALLEVVHALLGWVRSSPVTVAMQVASRIWMVWGIVETRQEVSSSVVSVAVHRS
jgi:very-long-chain (3R)-3-hydroxyacyl-CoA dehydratase